MATMSTVNRIRTLRTAQGITQEKLAEITGISTTHISRIEKGKRGLSLENAILISRALRVPVHEVDPEIAGKLPPLADRASSLDVELLEVLPKLSSESVKSVLAMALTLQKLEGLEPRK